MWSAPPAEPPAQTTFDVSAFSAAARSLIVLCGEFAGTTTTSGSPVRRAIGVTASRPTGDLLVRIAPTIVMPITISWLPSPFALLTNWASPTVPPAPGTLTTCTLLAAPVAVMTCCSERAAPSQPPPGAAGRDDLQLERGLRERRRRGRGDGDRCEGLAAATRRALSTVMLLLRFGFRRDLCGSTIREFARTGRRRPLEGDITDCILHVKCAK